MLISQSLGGIQASHFSDVNNGGNPSPTAIKPMEQWV